MDQIFTQIRIMTIIKSILLLAITITLQPERMTATIVVMARFILTIYYGRTMLDKDGQNRMMTLCRGQSLLSVQE